MEKLPWRMSQLPTGKKLRELTEELGIAQQTRHGYDKKQVDRNEDELQRDLLAFRKDQRAERMWIFVLVSMGISILSMIAAWVAAMR